MVRKQVKKRKGDHDVPADGNDPDEDVDGLRNHKIQIYSLTGEQCQYFWGIRKSVSEGATTYTLLPKEERPYYQHFLKEIVTKVASGNVQYEQQAAQLEVVFDRFIEDIVLPLFLPERPTVDLDTTQDVVDTWYQWVLRCFGANSQSTYLHMLCHHFVEHTRRDGSLYAWAQQGLETAHKAVKLALTRCTSWGGGWKRRRKHDPGEDCNFDDGGAAVHMQGLCDWLGAASVHIWSVSLLRNRKYVLCHTRPIADSVTQGSVMELEALLERVHHDIRRWREPFLFYETQAVKILNGAWTIK